MANASTTMSKLIATPIMFQRTRSLIARLTTLVTLRMSSRQQASDAKANRAAKLPSLRDAVVTIPRNQQQTTPASAQTSTNHIFGQAEPIALCHTTET